jgi:hypothetical protein
MLDHRRHRGQMANIENREIHNPELAELYIDAPVRI